MPRKKHVRINAEFQQQVMVYVEGNGLRAAAFKAKVFPHEINSIACRGYGSASSVGKVRRGLIGTAESGVLEAFVKARENMTPDQMHEIAARVEHARKVYDNTPKERFEI